MRNFILLVSLFALINIAAFSKNSGIAGRVSEANSKKPLAGVSIKIASGASRYIAISDRNGYYHIAAPSGKYTLTTTYLIYQDTAISDINISNNTLKYDFSINPNYAPISLEAKLERDSLDKIREERLRKSDSSKKALGEKKKPSKGKNKTLESAKDTEIDSSPVVEPSIDAFESSSSMVRKASKSSDVKKHSKSAGESKKIEAVPDALALESSTVAAVASDDFVPRELSSTRTPQPDATAGLLTSGELNDFRKWNLWKDLQDYDLKEYSQTWSIKPRARYTIQAITNDKRPAVDCSVKLLNAQGETIWASKTDNTGKAELWSNIYPEWSYLSKQGLNDGGAKAGETNFSSKMNIDTSFVPEQDYSVVIEKSGKEYSAKNIKEFHDGINTIKIGDDCNSPKVADIAFVVDATGSMSDEIKYLQAELIDIIGKLQVKQKDLTINLAAEFYRDKGDEYLIKKSDFTTDYDKTIKFIKEQSAQGGSDFPEAVEMALQSAINELSWSSEANARIIFLILDAPPHNDPAVKEKLREIVAKAAQDGIRIVPVMCSGNDKSTEYLLRAIALATNGSYVFLTDNSGIGDKHLAPSTDKYDVEKLNALFIRLIEQFVIVPECAVKSPFDSLKVSDNVLNQNEAQLDEKAENYANLSQSVKCYPNPTNGILNIELTRNIDELYLADISGKIVQKLAFSVAGVYQIDLYQYPTGVYFIKYAADNHWFITKTILQR